MKRLSHDKFFSNREQAPRTARHIASFILSNLDHLRKEDPHGRMEEAALKFHKMLEGGESLTPAQYSYLENIYEAVMRGAGFGGCRVHADRKRRGLKYG